MLQQLDVTFQVLFAETYRLSQRNNWTVTSTFIAQCFFESIQQNTYASELFTFFHCECISNMEINKTSHKNLFLKAIPEDDCPPKIVNIPIKKRK